VPGFHYSCTLLGPDTAGDATGLRYLPTEETVGAFAETATSIISAVCAERFDPTPAYQTCRFCDNADLCEKKEVGGE
jgi:hypothetical protein